MSSDNPGAMPAFLSIGKVISFHPATHLNLAEPSWLSTGRLHLVSLSFLEACLLWRLLNYDCTRVRTKYFGDFCMAAWVCGCVDFGCAQLYRGLKSTEEFGGQWDPSTLFWSLQGASNLVSAWSSIFWPFTLPHSFFQFLEYTLYLASSRFHIAVPCNWNALLKVCTVLSMQNPIALPISPRNYICILFCPPNIEFIRLWSLKIIICISFFLLLYIVTTLGWCLFYLCLTEQT